MEIMDIELVPLRKVSAKEVTDAFFDHCVSKYRVLVKCISYNGRYIVTGIFKAICTKM